MAQPRGVGDEDVVADELDFSAQLAAGSGASTTSSPGW
jgi:hypothetical protein